MKKSLLAASLFLGTFALANDPRQVIGLVCQYENHPDDVKVEIEFTEKGSQTLLTFREAVSLWGLGRMAVDTAVLTPIFSGNLEKMSGVMIEDPASQAMVEFRVRGRQFDGSPFLEVEAALKGKDVHVERCTVKYEVKNWRPW